MDKPMSGDVAVFRINWRRWSIALMAILIPATALGGRFQVRPVKLYFNARTKIVSFKVISGDPKNLTLQIQAVTWNQDDRGKAIYGKTNDLLVFPKLLKLKPNAERVVRVAIRGKKDPRREHAYRIFVEELAVKGRVETNTISVTLRLGMPVFVQPARVQEKWSVEDLSLENGRASVAVRNEGNQHMILAAIDVKGVDAEGRDLFSSKIAGWYVLGGSRRYFSVPIEKEKCLKLHILKVSARARNNDRREMEIKVTPKPSLCPDLKKKK